MMMRTTEHTIHSLWSGTTITRAQWRTVLRNLITHHALNDDDAVRASDVRNVVVTDASSGIVRDTDIVHTIYVDGGMVGVVPSVTIIARSGARIGAYNDVNGGDEWAMLVAHESGVNTPDGMVV